MDVIAPMGDARIQSEKLRDLENFGRTMLALASGSLEGLGTGDVGRWIEIVKGRRGGSLGGALSYLINLEGNGTRNINEFLANISDIMVGYVDASLQ